MDTSILREKLRKGDYKLSNHALIKRGLRKFTDDDIVDAILQGEIIEDYPDDPRGKSCLILGETKDDRPLHVVCGLADDGKLLMITVYFPDENEWMDFKTRR